MLKQINNCPSKKPYWVCVKCDWAWQSLQEANRHVCGKNPPAQPAFRSFTKAKVVE